MIQRIQSIYLLVGALVLASLFFFDSIWQSRAVEAYGWYAPLVVVLIAVTGAAAIAAIFMYKHRKRQRKVVLGVQVLTLLFMFVLYGGLYMSDALYVLAVEGTLQVGMLIALLLPVVAYIIFYLARRAIGRDIKLIQSMDRLR